MSKRNDILNAFVTTLKGISDFGNRVYKTILSPQDVNEFPVCMVVPNDAVYSPLTNMEYTSGSDPYDFNGFAVSVVIYGKVDEDIDLQGLLTDHMEDLIAKVITQVLSDVSLGLSFVRNVYLEQILPYTDWKNKIGAVEIIWKVKYDFEKSNP